MKSGNVVCVDRRLEAERSRMVRQLAAMLDAPMTVLAFLWVGLLILDLTRGLTGWLASLNHAIWALFVLQFAVEFLLAPHKGKYLRRNWLTAVALLLPALRVVRAARAFRTFRAARAARGVGVVRVVSSVNRGMAATRKAVRRRGLGYVALVTLLTTFAGAAGMYAFENPSALRENGWAVAADQGAGLNSYGDAVWWTAMTMTTMGSDYFPRTAEGRLLCWLLAVYAFAVFGYITASIASHFVDVDRRSSTGNANAAVLDSEVAALRAQIAALSEELRALGRNWT